MFAYCNNDPVNNIDTWGALSCSYYVKHNDGGVKYITDQEDATYGFHQLGITTISHGGCGVIASYNALLMLGNPKSFDDVLGCYNNHMALIPGKGLVGISPSFIAEYFQELGYQVITTNLPDLIDVYSQTADASIMYYEFPATYLGIEAYGAHFVAYQQTGGVYTAYNTSENNGIYSFSYPSDYGYKNSRYYAIGIYIYHK